jgi:hypothetical protein
MGYYRMPTVHRLGNIRFVVYASDHGPPHVHVFAGGGKAKILLEPAAPRLSVAWSRGFDRVTLRRAMVETMERRPKLMAAWLRYHGPKDEQANGQG